MSSRKGQQRIITETASKVIIKMENVSSVLSPTEMKRLNSIIDKLKEHDTRN